jgi:hypothetical protein
MVFPSPTRTFRARSRLFFGNLLDCGASERLRMISVDGESLQTSRIERGRVAPHGYSEQAYGSASLCRKRSDCGTTRLWGPERPVETTCLSSRRIQQWKASELAMDGRGSNLRDAVAGCDLSGRPASALWKTSPVGSAFRQSKLCRRRPRIRCPYSARRASTGFTDAARRAGM